MSEPTSTAQVVADYFLATVDEEAGDNLSNLKLQKLLYYAQGLHLAMHDGTPLFPEPIVAWDHGPIVESIYHHYKNHGWQGIGRPADIDIQTYPPEARELLDMVSTIYGQFSAKRLERMTHEEPPWQNTSRNHEITPESLRSFFTQIVEAGRQDQSVLDEPIWPSNAFRYQKRLEISSRMSPYRDRLGQVARRAPAGSNPWADDD